MTPEEREKLYDRYVWFHVPYRSVMVGDLVANGATVTAVLFGPLPDENGWGSIDVEKVRIETGESSARTAHKDSPLVIGRLKDALA